MATLSARIVRVLSEVVECIIETSEEAGLQQHEVEQRRKGRPPFVISREQLLLFLNMGSHSVALENCSVVVQELLNAESLNSGWIRAYISVILVINYWT